MFVLEKGDPLIKLMCIDSVWGFMSTVEFAVLKSGKGDSKLFVFPMELCDYGVEHVPVVSGSHM